MNSATKQIARQRFQILFQQAKLVNKTNPQLAQRYITVARKIAMSARMRFPVVYRRQICKECNALLVPGESCRVRIKPRREPHVVVTCLNCGNQTRIPIKTSSKVGTKQEKKENEQNNK
jgi:ribonuclease P protein subunit RPR2